MTVIREPAVAGQFYPENASELQTAITAFFEDVRLQPSPAPKALIVPHAGYIYSGPVAATAYARLRAYGKQYTRVILLGPAHRVAFKGLALSAADVFRTPLGDVPLIVGDVAAATVAEVIDALWGGPETLIVVSSDLSHYLAYEKARTIDNATCQAIENLEVDRINHHDACGATPISGLLIAARCRGMKVTTLDLRNSGDTAGDRNRVVGYGSWLFLEQIEPQAISVVSHHSVYTSGTAKNFRGDRTMSEIKIGIVTHYFTQLHAATVEILVARVLSQAVTGSRDQQLVEFRPRSIAVVERDKNGVRHLFCFACPGFFYRD